jgi:hypothetical protein
VTAKREGRPSRTRPLPVKCASDSVTRPNVGAEVSPKVPRDGAIIFDDLIGNRYRTC